MPGNQKTEDGARRAPLGRRAAAFAIDYLSIGAFASGLAMAVYTLGAQRWDLGPLSGQLVGFALLTAPVVLAMSAFESSGWRASPGKKVCGLVVVPAETGDPQALRLTFPSALLRNAGKFLPWELSHGAVWQMQPGGSPTLAFVLVITTWLLIGLYILGASRRGGQTLYDRLAGAVVRRHLGSG